MKPNSSIKQKALTASNMPKDIVLGIPVLTVLGDIEICIENYGGIIEYTEYLIRIRTKTGQILVHGKKLNVNFYSNEEMKICGKVTSIEFR